MRCGGLLSATHRWALRIKTMRPCAITTRARRGSQSADHCFPAMPFFMSKVPVRALQIVSRFPSRNFLQVSKLLRGITPGLDVVIIELSIF